MPIKSYSRKNGDTLHSLRTVTHDPVELVAKICAQEDWWSDTDPCELTDQGKWYVAVVEDFRLFLTDEGVKYAEENWL